MRLPGWLGAPRNENVGERTRYEDMEIDSYALVEALLNEEQAKLDALGDKYGIVWDVNNQTDHDTDVFKEYEVDELNGALDVLDGITSACDAFGASAAKGDDGRWRCAGARDGNGGIEEGDRLEAIECLNEYDKLSDEASFMDILPVLEAMVPLVRRIAAPANRCSETATKGDDDAPSNLILEATKAERREGREGRL